MKKSSLLFKVHGSVHRNNILVYKSQQDAHVTEIIFVGELLYMFPVSLSPISSRNKAQVNKTPYFSWPSTPCLRQQPHEKNRSTPHPQHTHINFNSSTTAEDKSMGMYIIIL